MASPGPNRPAKIGAGAETPDGDLAELRELLLGPERAELNELLERMRNRTQRTSDLSDVLPEAILLRSRRDPHLTQALQPIVEQALSNSVRKDPSILSEALFPMIGAAVRRAVASALQEMMESLNQIIETSVSFRSIRWRIEAVRTGKTYGEIALLRSLLYRVEQVFLIQNETGLLLQHVISDSAVVRDPDMVSGMLTAIQNFVQDSFGAADNTLETVRLGDFSLWVQPGPQALLAAVIRGTPPVRVREVFSSALETIHRDCGAQLSSFQGDATCLDDARPVLETCLLGQSPPGRRVSRWPIYLVGAVFALALAIWLGISVREDRRWQRYLTALGREPGIVITRQERSGRHFSISGLRDPLARDPAQLLHSVGVPAAKVSSNWEAYLSLSPRFVAMREIPGLSSRLEQQVIHFETGESALAASAVDSLRAAADVAMGLLKATEAVGEKVRIEITGHTDDQGSADENIQLGLARGAAVKSALEGLGVRASSMTVRSAGSTEPLVTPGAGNLRAENRSVSFRVLRLRN
jgi:OOP family OmpA-OmpF porin